MQLAQPGPIVSVPATTALEANRCVGIAGTYEADKRPLGVTQAKYASGEMAALQTSGIVVVEAGGGITAGDMVKVDAAGKVVTHTAGVTYTATDLEKLAGRAIDTASGDGIFIRVKLV